MMNFLDDDFGEDVLLMILELGVEEVSVQLPYCTSVSSTLLEACT